MKRWLCGFMAFCVLLMPILSSAEDENLTNQNDISQETSATPEPMDEATAEPEETPQAAAEATATPEAVIEETATPAPTDEAAAEPSTESSTEPTSEPTSEPADTPTAAPEATAEPIDWESAWEQDAWFYEEGYTAIFAGTLDDVVHELLQRDEQAQTEGSHEVVLCNDRDVLEIKDIHRSEITRFIFMMDDRVIEGADDKIIRIEAVSEDDQDAEQTDPQQVVSFRVWIELIEKPTDAPTDAPTSEPTDAPTDVPTSEPTDAPTDVPTSEPTDTPTDAPTSEPTDAPTDAPTSEPTDAPTDVPTSEPTDAPTDAPTDEPTATPVPVTLTVESDSYTAGQWMNALPVFRLSGMPEDASYWEYAVVEYGKRIELIDGDMYEAAADGQYTLRFVILDDLGDVAASSENYDIMVDITAPEIMVNTMTGVSYQMEISASDEQSGVDAVSIDGGETWTALSIEEPFIYTGSKTDNVIAAGKIQVRDAAGNIAVYDEEVLLERMSYGGGGGGGGDGKPYQPHSSGSGETGPGYDKVTVSQEQEPMHVLKLDDEEMALELNLDSAEGFEFDEAYQPVFMMSLTSWPTLQLDEEGNALPDAEYVTDESAEPDTMLLDAQLDEGITGAYAYRWTIGGATMRQLMKSGIKYLVLKTGDHVTALPTEGFLAGERYTELKMQGTSTRLFTYDIVMKREDASQADMPDDVLYTSDIYVTVDEQTTLLGSEESAEMYLINVFSGPSQLMSVPYGLWTDDMVLDMEKEAKEE